MLTGPPRGICLLRKFRAPILRAAALFVVLVVPAFAQEDKPGVPLGKGAYIGGAPADLTPEETARQLANPNTPLASLTLKNQWTHWGGDLPGADDGSSGTFLFQPSFPFPVSRTGTIFCRPAFPYLVDQPVVDAVGRVGSKTGFGDMGVDLAYGYTSGSGTLLVLGMIGGLPIGADGLSSETWALGPEFLIGRLKKNSVLAVFPSHQWDVSGPRETSLTSIQPVVAFLPGGGWSIGTNGTVTYNWESEQWTVPVQLLVSRSLKVGKIPLKLALEASTYVEKADALGQEWMIGLNITPVVPNVLAQWVGAN